MTASSRGLGRRTVASAVNLWDGRIGAPMTYATVVAFFQRLQRRTGIYARPHMLRHTHATELIRTGKWDLAYVAERLGHANVGR